ncbi:unnamed protein product [Closterium sp. Naga37s-1]|nr:unnamed protein product [Closterium sp. Naga37s-1]
MKWTLRIFHSMGWTVDPHHSDYSRFKLRLMARRITHPFAPFAHCPPSPPQLRIFHSMKWAVDPHHSEYSRFKLRLMARRITGSLHQGVPFEAGDGAASNGDASSGDVQLRAGMGQEGEVGTAGAGASAAGAAAAAGAEGGAGGAGGAGEAGAAAAAGASKEAARAPEVYRCRKCRQVVAAAGNVLPHAPKPPASTTDAASAAAGGGDGAAAAGTGGGGGGGVRFRGKGKDWGCGAERGCTSVFVEPLKWMGDGEHEWKAVRRVKYRWV